jgi:hypothetical protein
MKIRNQEKTRRILARTTALELSPEELAKVCGTFTRDGGTSCALVTSPNFTEDN